MTSRSRQGKGEAMADPATVETSAARRFGRKSALDG